MNIYMYTYKYVYINIFISMYIRIHIYVCMYIHVYIELISTLIARGSCDGQKMKTIVSYLSCLQIFLSFENIYTHVHMYTFR
jgi:hypothetical protein